MKPHNGKSKWENCSQKFSPSSENSYKQLYQIQTYSQFMNWNKMAENILSYQMHPTLMVTHWNVVTTTVTAPQVVNKGSHTTSIYRSNAIQFIYNPISGVSFLLIHFSGLHGAQCNDQHTERTRFSTSLYFYLLSSFFLFH